MKKKHDQRNPETFWGIPGMNVRLKNAFMASCKAHGLPAHLCIEALVTDQKLMSDLFHKRIYEYQPIKNKLIRRKNRNAKKTVV